MDIKSIMGRQVTGTELYALYVWPQSIMGFRKQLSKPQNIGTGEMRNEP